MRRRCWLIQMDQSHGHRQPIFQTKEPFGEGGGGLNRGFQQWLPTTLCLPTPGFRFKTPGFCVKVIPMPARLIVSSLFGYVFDGYRNVFKFRGRVRRMAYGIFLVVHMFLSCFVFPPIVQWGCDMLYRHGPEMLTPVIFAASTTRTPVDGYILSSFLLFPFLFAVVPAFVKPVPKEGGSNHFGPDPRSPDIDPQPKSRNAKISDPLSASEDLNSRVMTDHGDTRNRYLTDSSLHLSFRQPL